jgi:hypothetical protein
MNKKIIILSENSDLSTNDVMKQCKIKGYDVRRVNYDDRNLQIYISEICVNVSTSFDSFSIEPDDICWFRRADFPPIYIHLEKNPVEQEKKIFDFAEKRQTYYSIRHWISNNCKCSSEFFNDTFNKIDVLLKAKKSGIKIANWIVTDNKDYAISFAKHYEFVACKPFTTFFLHTEKAIYKGCTTKFLIS